MSCGSCPKKKKKSSPRLQLGDPRVELRGLHAVLLRGLGLHAVGHVDALELQLRVLLAELHHLSRAGK